ncbi:fam-l protein [Plasmodium brasilianum]|uniref:Fam-l protein n=1 Tax=Plasmodium brasilianum TaxID=5824 RepID=A0ACB9Y9G1_PLABR|nr:fam-l protein [Plasmodium brasilianum]
MEQKIKSLLFIKIATFNLFIWICYFCIFTSTFNKSLDECYKHSRKLYTINYRLLAKYEHDNDSIIVRLKEGIQNGVHDRRDKSRSGIFSDEKKKKPNGGSPRIERSHKKYMKNKYHIFETKKLSYLEKKIFKELDYEDFLKNNRTFSDKVYKKIIFKKCGLRVALPLLVFLVLSLSYILDKFWGYGLTSALYNVILIFSPVQQISIAPGNSIKISSAIKDLHDFLNKPSLQWFTQILLENTVTKKIANFCVTGFLGFLIYFVPLFILSIMLISAVVYYHKKVKKYEKIKFRKR